MTVGTADARAEGTRTDGGAAERRPPAPARGAGRTRLRVGRLWVDVVTAEEALDAIVALVEAGRGGFVFTPNVDHVVLADADPRFRRAYRRASLVLADGMPVVWASHLLRPALREKLSGSDMVEPLVALAARRGWRVYLLGGGPGAAAGAAERFRAEFGAQIVGVDDARIGLEPDPAVDGPVVARIRAARPDLLLVALGTPKQELFIDRVAADVAPAVALGLGASLDFVAGKVRRAPRWMSAAGFEWLFRLGSEPRRLWRRYLVRDPRFVLIVLRTLRLRHVQRRRTIFLAPRTGSQTPN